jgi:hypothetical protein
VLALLAASALLCQAQTVEERRNWFDDPFFQVTAALADCPVPAGPFITEAERQVQAHHRAERGTTCWLAGQCDRPNDYAYDHDIAAAFRAAWAQHPPAVGATTLWVTVQGRVVYIEGCAAREAAAAQLEAFARSLPNVRQAIASLRTRPSERAPYPLRSPP